MRALREFAEQLDDVAGQLRSVAARGRVLSGQAAELRAEAKRWEERLARARAFGDEELMVAAARMSGRVEGQARAAERELADCLAAEGRLRGALSEHRRAFARMLDLAQSLGLDVSNCMLHIDLTLPPPDTPPEPGEDEEREFLARVVDGLNVH